MLRKKYYLDKKDLLYKQLILTFRQKLSRFIIGLVLSLLLAVIYGISFKHFFGLPKEQKLVQEVEEMKLKYRLLENDFSRIEGELNDIAAAEDNVYRPVFDMEVLEESFRQSGFGGSRKYEELQGYENSDIMISASMSLEKLLRSTYVQSRSFEEIIPVASDWNKKLEHIPSIRPVKIGIPLGEGLRFREKHPVLGSPRWHYGQDFTAPSGTEVFATGSGSVSRAGWTKYGFGNRVEINHGYGFKTIYGHLSAIFVEPGHEIQRGDMLGLSGTTGVSSGPHLHYEIHYNGKAQNPLYFFDDDLSLSEWNEMIDVLLSDTIR